MKPSATASEPASRIAALDALRGFALTGILLINILIMGGPIDASLPASVPDFADPDWQIWGISHLFIDGAMRGLFSVLFGASLLLFLRAGARTAAALRRYGWLMVFGIANATLLLWPGDILVVYALAGPFILLFSRARPATLFLAAGAILVVISVWSYLAALPEADADGQNAAALAGMLSEETAARLGGYWENLTFMAQTSLDWTLSWMTPWWVLDAAAFMLVGMALFRLGLLDGQAPLRVYAGLALAGFGLGLPLRALEAWALLYGADGYPAIAEATFQSGRLLMTLGWLGLFMLMWRKVRQKAVFAPFSALGRTALSGYLSQSIVAAFIFSGFGLGLWNQLSWPAMWALALAIMIGLSLLAMAWLSVFRMGPMEWIWRALIFWRRPT